MIEIKKKIVSLVSEVINEKKIYKEEIYGALKKLLKDNYDSYDFNLKCEISSNFDDFQIQMAHINEKTDKQKNNGVYYTPSDITDFITINTCINRVCEKNDKTYEYELGIKKLLDLEEEKKNQLLYKYSIIDPTCGTGEFIVSVIHMKIDLLKKKKELNDQNILKIAKTVSGNDIDSISCDICKLRTFIQMVYFLKDKENINKLAQTINLKYSNVDFIEQSKDIATKYDIVIGNPPYVEYGKYPWKNRTDNSFGNVYADVMKNSIEIIKNNGTFGFIIPLSYISTPRMKNIRCIIENNMEKQFILSYADRPDCLFAGVHQKLNIVIAKKGTKKCITYTSNYKHWYKEERNKILAKIETIENETRYPEFIPKLGNELEKSIFNKVYTNDALNLIDIQSKSNEKVYLNMRACFWVKAFTFNPGSSEYKSYEYSPQNRDFILCLLNSSLFWIYWTMMSDCWHITTKELKSFYVPKQLDNTNEFHILAQKLENRLESTKKYVGTKQVDYEYKHKYCKDIIDKIDEELAKLYNLSIEELNYVKKYAVNYRIGGEKIV